MGNSIFPTSFFTLFLCIIIPVYLHLHGSASLPGTASLFSSLSQRVQAVHVALTSPLESPLAPIFEQTFETLTEPVEAESRRRNIYPALPDGLAHSINSFEQYAFLGEGVLQRKYARYAKQTPAQKAMSNKLGYHAHFEKARKGIEANARFAEQVALIARGDYHIGPRPLDDIEDAEFGLVDLVFGHLSRDWSSQGAKERQAVIPPILEGFEQRYGGNGMGRKVLVPGSGVGRLASDVADLGAYMLLCRVEVCGLTLAQDTMSQPMSWIMAPSWPTTC